jgi:sialic acid synthase SpsE
MDEMMRYSQDFAEYVKFQLYDSSKLNPHFPNYKTKKVEYQDFEITDTDIDFIFDRCAKYGIKPMFTIFNESRINSIEYYKNEDFGIKIASPDASKFDFIEGIIKKLPDKLIIISTGMIDNLTLINARRRFPKAKFLYCISKYPTVIEDVSINAMGKFDGFSDHSTSLEIATLISMMLPNLEFYERHYTLSRLLPGKDQLISIQASELARLYQTLNQEIIYNNYKERFGQE